MDSRVYAETGRAKKTSEERKKVERRERKAERGCNRRRAREGEKKREIRRRNLLHRWLRVSGYRYITRLGRCACKRVKRRDIFYIYGYLPLLCSRAGRGGLRQRANRPLFLPRSLRLSPSPSVSLCATLLWPPFGAPIAASFFDLPCAPLPRLGQFGRQCRTQAAAGPCVISHAIPYSVPTMICSRLVPRSRWISFMGVRVCPTSIYRRGVPHGVQPTP